MLGKLSKTSLKATFNAVYNIYIAMAVIGVIMLVMLLVDWTKWGDTGVGVGYLIKIVASAALCITAGIGVLMTFVAVFSEFRRNMYGNEGYLTLSLPVRSSTLMLAKWLAASFWVIVSYLALVGCAFGSFIYIVKHSMNEYASTYDLVMQLVDQLSYSAGAVTPSINVILNLAAMYAFSGAVRACVFVLIVFFAITLSHCRPFSKRGKLGTLIYFFASFFGVYVFAAIITKLVKIYIVVSDTHYTVTLSEYQVQQAWMLGFGAYSITNIYCTVIAAIFLFMICCLLLDRKVNAD